MKIQIPLTWALLVCVEYAAGYAITIGLEQPIVTSVAAVITPTDLVRIHIPTSSTVVTSATAVQAPLSTASITTVPKSDQRFSKRQTQKCFNDQGFQVDCATWTGYYYSWGPPGNPYEGGPGDGQWDGNTGDYGGNGDNGDGSGTIVYVQSGAALDQLSITMVAGVCFLAIALIL